MHSSGHPSTTHDSALLQEGTDADHLRVLRGDRHSQEDGCCLRDHVECGWSAREGDPQLSDHHRRIAGIARLAPASRMHPRGYGVDRSVHASPNLAKKVLNWEYVREILRTDLRTRLVEHHQAWPERIPSFSEGSIPQGPGAPYAQIVPPSEPQAPGGHHHV